MTASHAAGPAVTFGNAKGIESNPEAGPNVDYQGSAVMDVRYPYQPGMTGRGHVRAFLNHAYVCLLDATPQALAATQVLSLSLGAVVPAGGTLAIPTQATNNGLGRGINVPLVPFGQAPNAANVKTVLTIDPAHTTCQTTSGSAVVTIPAGGDARMIQAGQFVCIPGAAGGVLPLIARVVRKTLLVNGTGTLTLDRAAGATINPAPLMLMDLNGISVVPFVYAGADGLFDTRGTVSRVLTYASSSASDTGYSVTTVGYDAALNLMSETVNLTAGGSVNGRKAFKHILSCTLNKAGGGTTVGTVTIGTSDIFGLNMRGELWEYFNIFYAGAFVSASTGYTAGDSTTANTTSTTDVRGTYAVQSASNGTNRLAIFLNLPTQQIIAATWDDPTPLFGVAQA